MPFTPRAPSLGGMAQTRRILPKVTVGEIVRMLPQSTRHQYSAGTVILKEGTRADSCFLILSGRVQISKRMKVRTSTNLAVMKKGDFFGEMAMLSGQPRSATATALNEVKALEIKRSDFLRLLDRQDPLAARLALHFSSALALRCSRVLQLLAKNPGERAAGPKQAVDVRKVLHRVYSLWAV